MVVLYSVGNQFLSCLYRKVMKLPYSGVQAFLLKRFLFIRVSFSTYWLIVIGRSGVGFLVYWVHLPCVLRGRNKYHLYIGFGFQMIATCIVSPGRANRLWSMDQERTIFFFPLIMLYLGFSCYTPLVFSPLVIYCGKRIPVQPFLRRLLLLKSSICFHS